MLIVYFAVLDSVINESNNWARLGGTGAGAGAGTGLDVENALAQDEMMRLCCKWDQILSAMPACPVMNNAAAQRFSKLDTIHKKSYTTLE